MLQDIQQCTVQYLNHIFSPLDGYPNYVFWIRNSDMSRQIYVSSSYLSIWQQDSALLYEIPLIWFDYLNQQDRTNYMVQLQDRHVNSYLDQSKNIVFYQIDVAEGKQHYIRDRSFRCQDNLKNQYVVGVSEKLSSDFWSEQFNDQQLRTDESSSSIYKVFFGLLKSAFGFTLMQPNLADEKFMSNFRKFISPNLQYSFTKREHECLVLFCQGKTYKETARVMAISPRTVETYLENIFIKTGCRSKAEVISQFSRFFIQDQVIMKKIV